MQEIIQIQDRYYILASAYTDAPRRVLKSGDTFALFDSRGDVQSIGNGEQGLYHQGTRFLSSLTLRLWSRRPLLLSSTVSRDNTLLVVDLMNPDIYRDQQLVVPRGTLHVFRSKFLWQGACHERLRLSNFGAAPLELAFSLDLGADFADLFEVRGTRRQRRGVLREPRLDPDGVTLAYEGLDGVLRSTRLRVSPRPFQVTGSRLELRLRLSPRESSELELQVDCQVGEETGARSRPGAAQAAAALASSIQERAAARCEVRTSNELFNEWLRCSLADLTMMITQTPEGPYPYAGVPWFSTVFGRDGLITALETLWIDPELARGVLGHLAATQAREHDPERDAAPGKIVHELRDGEMAALGEIPFGRYYGSVDATPLFLLLAGAYFERTGDRAFLEQLWPHLEAALGWLESEGDRDRDGFGEYERAGARGLVQQGWKDSQDSIFHHDGSLAPPPIALCEVQGYLYAAREELAQLAAALGRDELAGRLRAAAAALRERFDQQFWCEELSTYALALDGEKRPCRVRTSNAGHMLFTGIALPARAAPLVETLFAQDSFSGWGIRTVAAGEPRYNPMSYHNGSIWPHDNALIALGLARYGFKEHTLRLLSALFDASLFVEMHRLPELFSGFKRRAGEAPTLYPVACSPQAWAAGAPFLLLAACLGLTVSGSRGQVRFQSPVLPPFLEEVHLRRLRVGASTVDVSLRRLADDVAINVLRRDGPVEVVVAK